MAGDTTESFGRDENDKFYSDKFLKFAEKHLCFQKYGRVVKMPLGRGKTYRFKKLLPPATATNPTPLVEGVTPDPLNMTRDEVRADLVEFGNWLIETNRMREIFEDKNNLTDNQNTFLGTKMKEEREMALFNILKAGTNVQYANGSSRSSVNTTLTYSKFQIAARNLENGLDGRAGEPLKKMMRTDGRFGTVSIEPAYIVIIHPDLMPDVRALEGFVSVADYGQRTNDHHERGKVDNFRFICTTLPIHVADAGGAKGANNVKSTSGTNADVYLVLCIAEGAYASIAVGGKRASALIRKSITSGGASNALNQRGSVGYRMYFAGAILYQERMLRLEVAATDVPGAA